MNNADQPTFPTTRTEQIAYTEELRKATGQQGATTEVKYPGMTYRQYVEAHVLAACATNWEGRKDSLIAWVVEIVDDLIAKQQEREK